MRAALDRLDALPNNGGQLGGKLFLKTINIKISVNSQARENCQMD